MQIEKLLEEQKAKAHIHWLNRAKTAKVDGMELTVLPYGFLTQAVEKSVNEILKQFIDGLMESLEGKREEDLSDKDIEDRLRVFTLTPFSEESIKEFVKVIGGISAKMGKNKAINDQISHLKEIRKQLE